MLSLFVIVVGVRFLVTPRAAALGYGVPAEEGMVRRPRPRSSRVRERPRRGLVHAGRRPRPLGDTIIVLRQGGTKATAFGIHFATAVVVLVDAALLFTV